MKWDQIVPSIRVITAKEAKQTLQTEPTRMIQLIDVRQTKEYSQHHLPGAIPIPLSELTNNPEKLDRRLPVLLYCQTGERSLMAARWLSNHDFKEVAVIQGGIDAWESVTAFGHFELNLNLLQTGAEFADAVAIAYAMEEGMRQFYILLARETGDELYKELYRELAHYEVLHMQELARECHIELGPSPLQQAEKRFGGQLVEGGGFLNQSLIKTLASTTDVSRVFSLALAFETQALDFYYRLSLKAETESIKRFFQKMADSERTHLAFVSEKLDAYLTHH